MQCFTLPAGFWPAKALFRRRHSGVHAASSEYFIKSELIEVEYAKILAYAFETRQDADYDVAFSADKDLATEMLRDAVRFVHRMKLYLHKAGV
jgi:uncharacterized protein (UPF0332 family)